MRYYIIAGEASGDLHGSNLMKGLYAEDPEARMRFWGGALMQAVWQEKDDADGGGLVVDYKDGAVMGFWEVLMKARSLTKKIERCKADILAYKPDVVILIDYPGFNFKIAEFAHGKGLKVFYYIAPKVWASRESRIKKLKAYVDRLFIVFPFEEPYFQKHGVPYIYKGNPLIDAIDNSEALRETREEFLAKTGLPDAKYVALLAGSRGNELAFMMPRLVELADRMHALPQYADWHFILAGAPSRTPADYEKYTGTDRPYLHVVFDQTYAVLRHSEAAVIKSGTASLEGVLIGTPQVVGYGSNSNISYLIGRQIIRVKYISLGNLIIDRGAFRELLQQYCTADSLMTELRRLLEDEAYRARMKAEYAEIRERLGGSGASAAVARAMISELR